VLSVVAEDLNPKPSRVMRQIIASVGLTDSNKYYTDAIAQWRLLNPRPDRPTRPLSLDTVATATRLIPVCFHAR
jgi:hypothetical protein